MVENYRPPVGPESNPENNKENKEYIPPVGPGSKSLPPGMDYRDLPLGILPDLKNKES